MSGKIRNVALLLPALVLATGLASAQPGIKVTSTNPDGSVSTTTIKDSTSGPNAKAPAAGRFWDGLSATDYFGRPPFVTKTPNPQLGVGPDDVLTIVNRSIARYPNPNAGGAGQGITVPNPYLNPPTELIWLDVWLGITVLNPISGGAGGAALCPSGTGNNSTCVIDNASIRYDQLQGRFVVLMTVTDLPAHRSNFVVIVSRFSQFTKCSSTTPSPATCPASSPLFSPPVIAPIVGGTQTGGQNGFNWVLYAFPINLTYRTDNAGNTTETALGNGLVSTPNPVTSGGVVGTNFLTTPFCPNGGPATLGGVPASNVVARSCTNYFPTEARMGFDNDNMILTAPVLDMSFGPLEGTLATSTGQPMGPYAGTRVVTVSKLMLYNGTAFSVLDQPPVCTTANPVSCLAVNLADNTATGTLTTLGFVNVANPVASAFNAPNCAVLNPLPNTCAPIANGTILASVNNVITAPGISIPFPAIFWEPDNIRGRALASFDAQTSPFGNLTSGVITPFDYLVGTRISDNFGVGFINDGTTGTQYFLQPIVFSCPGVTIFSDPVPNCGSVSSAVVSELAMLGPLRTNAFTQLAVSDPRTVGQGFSAQQLTTNPLNNPVSPTNNSRLFVGDSRPQQVMFREGLLYVARNVRSYDLNTVVFNALNTSTVLYDLLKTCAAQLITQPVGTNGNSSPNCGGYSVIGGGITGAAIAMSGIWTNSTNVFDPAGNTPGFGFYQPMFESPADVVNSLTGGPTPPINTFPWLENVFVGMTTGGSSNVAATFSKNYPSLWDFRPGDDAFDTIEPYLDPYTGVIRTAVPCPTDITVQANVTKNSATITVNDATGLAVGMFLTSSAVSSFPAQIKTITPNGTGGATIVLTSNITSNTTGSGTPPVLPVALTFTLNQPGVTTTITQIVDGSNQITVSSTAGLLIGQAIASTSTVDKTPTIIVDPRTSINLPSTSNVGVGEVVTGRANTIPANTINFSNIIFVPSNSLVAPGQNVSGPGIPAGTVILPGGICPIATCPDPTTLQVALSNNATANGTAVPLIFDSSPFFAAGTVVTGPPAVNGVTPINPAALLNTGIVPTPFGNGITVRLTANYGGGTNAFLPAGTVITNIVGNVITLSNNARVNTATFPNIAVFPQCTVPLPGGGNTNANCSSNIPVTVVVGLTATVCPMIPFSTRGGAQTDPNDGSLWLYGEFAKNRLSTIPGPGEWGTAVANYPLTFPATDTYNNDNTFFQDVQPGNVFFTWIQIAKNVGLAQPALTGPCTINNGGTPIPQPPAPGTTPTPSPSTLICPYFGPDTIVTRAEMAYWVVRSQMDELQVTNFLCATGGDPTGAPCPGVSGGVTASSFADVTSGIINPFVSVSVLGFPGVTTNQLIRYIEVMYRRGYTKGCGSTNDPLRRYCPNNPVLRQEMSVFLIRAKMNNVFPTTLSGLVLSGPYGDNFGLFQPTPAYFADVPNSGATGDYYLYIQKMRELRITNGTSGSTFSPTNQLTRKEIVTFVVRAFFL